MPFCKYQKDIERYDIGFENFQILELLYSKGPHPVQKLVRFYPFQVGASPMWSTN